MEDIRIMNRIFDKSNIYFKNTNNRMFQYDKFAYACTRSANKCVKNDFADVIVLSKEEIETLILSFDFKDEWYTDNCQMLDDCLNEAYDTNMGQAMFEHEDLRIVIERLDAVADSTEHVGLMNTLIHWYGFRRESVAMDRDFIPQDIGRGNYDDEEYCGTTNKEMIFAEPVHVEDDEELELVVVGETPEFAGYVETQKQTDKKINDMIHGFLELLKR